MTTPSIPRCAGLGLVGAAGLAVLAGLPGTLRPPADPAAFADWWVSVGPAHATIALVRVVGMGLAAFLLVTALGGALTAATGTWLNGWHRLTPRLLRHVLVASTLSATALATSVAEGQESPPPVLQDLGPVEAGPGPAVASMVLRDLGPVDLPIGDPEAARTAGSDALPEPDTWVVARGDHLWAVAEATVQSHGLDADLATTTEYWARLIEANRATVGHDPDLIHPGDVLVLPPLTTDPQDVRVGS